ncbi:MAG TPA: hypothetical protein VJK51_03455 [Candidatus Nanoarchaeia archaeon]|nr:hypothetical protein [Candidatus Nanoarchaeia archaeon]
MNIINGRFDVLIQQINVEEPSRLFNCNKIEYIHDRDGDFFDHHLMFYRKEGKKYQLLFKVWLRNSPKDKKYKDIKEAMKDVGISLYRY